MKLANPLKYIGLISALLLIIPILGYKFISFKLSGFTLLGGMILFLIGCYIEEHKTETLSSTQQDKRKSNLDALRNALVAITIVLIVYIAITLGLLKTF